MHSDPLEFFDKVAKKAKPKPDDEVMDAGERALAGLAVASSAVAIHGEWLANKGLSFLSNKGEVSWPGHSPGEFSTIKETLKALDRDHPNLPNPRPKRLLGLIPIRERFKPGSPIALDRAVREMNRMQPTVDSFIKKYDLKKKGVTFRFKGGRYSGGPAYDIFRKRVELPYFSEATTLHELGHAADFTGTRRAKFWGRARIPVQAAVATAIPIALIAGDEIKKALPGTIDDHVIDFMQQNAPSILAATLAATHLYPEGKATALTLKHIKNRRGTNAMRDAAKKLLPAWGTYALMAIAPVVGMALAKKYYNETKNRDLDKEASKTVDALRQMVLNDKSRGWVARQLKGRAIGYLETADDIESVGRQIGKGVKSIISQPDRLHRIGTAAKEVGTSSEFIEGALYAGIPATLATAYIYSKRHGSIVREKMERVSPYDLKDILRTGGVDRRVHDYAKDKVPESWKVENPGLYAGLVGAGAAMSGGILMKLFSDLSHAM